MTPISCHIQSHSVPFFCLNAERSTALLPSISALSADFFLPPPAPRPRIGLLGLALKPSGPTQASHNPDTSPLTPNGVAGAKSLLHA